MNRRNPFLAFIQIGFFLLIYPFCRLLLFKKRFWLVCERGNDARDNGYWFYRYLCENTNENAIYIIKHNSVDFLKVKRLGKTIEYGSLKHWFYFCGAQVIATTHLGAIAPARYVGAFINKHKIPYFVKNIFLQHGITYNYQDFCYYDNHHLDLFVCGAKKECFEIKKIDAKNKPIAIHTGFPRFDNLHNTNTKNQILIMPTWRYYLRDYSKNEFIKSNYFLIWNSFLQSKTTLELLEKNNLSIVFYPHYSLQKFISCFKTNINKITICDFNNFDVQTLLKESKLLITDYSSIFFDFAYMNKPIIYYQFDKKEFYSKHYQKGYFDIENDGFGKVVNNQNELLEELTNIIKNNFCINKEYMVKSNVFFGVKDKNNSKRIYDKICEILKNKKRKILNRNVYLFIRK